MAVTHPSDYYVHKYSGEEIDAILSGAIGDAAQSLTPTQQHQAQKNIGVTWPCNPNLLVNGDFRDGCLVDQRKGRVVKPSTTYYSDKTLTTAAGTTSAYVTAYRYATGTENGTAYASFKLTDTDAAPTYYAAPADVVRGYAKTTGYGVDMLRQQNDDCVTLIEDDGITLLSQESSGYAYFAFKCEIPFAELSTYKSVLSNGVVYGFSSSITIGDAYFYTTYTAPTYQINVRVPAGKSIKLTAMKMELGDTQTLAHQDDDGNWALNELPRYADTLARCQRYLRPVLMSSWGDVNITAVLNSAKTRLEMRVDMRGNPMRTTPSLIVLGTNSVRAVFVGESGVSVVSSLLEAVISSAACASYVSVGIVPASDATYTARSLTEGVSVDALSSSPLKAFLSAEL